MDQDLRLGLYLRLGLWGQLVLAHRQHLKNLVVRLSQSDQLDQLDRCLPLAPSDLYLQLVQLLQ